MLDGGRDGGLTALMSCFLVSFVLRLVIIISSPCLHHPSSSSSKQGQEPLLPFLPHLVPHELLVVEKKYSKPRPPTPNPLRHHHDHEVCV